MTIEIVETTPEIIVLSIAERDACLRIEIIDITRIIEAGVLIEGMIIEKVTLIQRIV
jgi:hypothetical protein